MVTTRRHRPYL